MIKSINRMKVSGLQAIGRAEKTEVLNDNLQLCEKGVENIRQACYSTNKKLKDCLQGSGQDIEKRQKKLPFYILSQNMWESSQLLGDDSIFGLMLAKGSEACAQISSELTSHEMVLENLIIQPYTHSLEHEFPKIAKAKNRLSKLTLDMDSTKAKFHNAVKAYSQGKTPEQQAKIDAAKEEMDDANIKMEQCKDLLANEMMNIVSKEQDYARSIIDMVSAQAQYHRNALARLEVLVPKMMEIIEQSQRKPVYGTPLEEHLECEEVKIAVPLQICVDWLNEFGIDEEGLFRIAGSASKVKLLTSALNVSMELPIHDFIGHEHAVAGALKQYLRELPEPLLTFALYDDLVEAQGIKENEEKLRALWNILHRLPKGNKDNFEFLVRFLYKVSLKSDKNRMGPTNLALVIGPNVMKSESEQGVSAATMGVASSILESFILNATYFFPEPSPTIEYIMPIDRPNGDVPKTSEPVVPPTPQSMTPPPPQRAQPGVTSPDGAKPSVPQNQAQRHRPKTPSFRLKTSSFISRKSSKKGQAPLPPGPTASTGDSPVPSPTNSLTRQNNLESSSLAPFHLPAAEYPKDDSGQDEVDSSIAENGDDDSVDGNMPDKASNDSLDKISASEDSSDVGIVNEETEEASSPPPKEKPARPSIPKRQESKDGPPGVAAKPAKPDRPPDAPTAHKVPEKPDRPGKPGRPYKPPLVKPDKTNHADERPKPSKPHKPPPVPKNPPTKKLEAITSEGFQSSQEPGPPALSPPPGNPKSPGVKRPRMVPPPPPKTDGTTKDEGEESTHF